MSAPSQGYTPVTWYQHERPFPPLPPLAFSPKYIAAQLNPDLLSPQERARFRDLVGILLSCGLTFSPQSASSSSSASAPPAFGAAAGAQEFALEPAIDQVGVTRG